jgi:hypothetical protein
MTRKKVTMNRSRWHDTHEINSLEYLDQYNNEFSV